MEGIAAASTALATQQVQTAVAIHALKQANSQQESALSLLEGAMELAQQIQQVRGDGRIDVRG